MNAPGTLQSANTLWFYRQRPQISNNSVVLVRSTDGYYNLTIQGTNFGNTALDIIVRGNNSYLDGEILDCVNVTLIPTTDPIRNTSAFRFFDFCFFNMFILLIFYFFFNSDSINIMFKFIVNMIFFVYCHLVLVQFLMLQFI